MEKIKNALTILAGLLVVCGMAVAVIAGANAVSKSDEPLWFWLVVLSSTH